MSDKIMEKMRSFVGPLFFQSERIDDDLSRVFIGLVDLYFFDKVLIGFYDRTMKSGVFMVYEKLPPDGFSRAHELKEQNLAAAVKLAQAGRNLITNEARDKVFLAAYAAVARQIEGGDASG